MLSRFSWSGSPSRRAADRAIVAGLAVTLVGALAAMAWLWRYKSSPGPGDAAPAVWPDASRIERTRGRPTVVMFAHPRCPCTLASVSELRAALSGRERQVDAQVLFFVPPGEQSQWADSASWRAAESIPGVRVSIDAARAESRRFGATTSGHVVAYDIAGKLQFSGGITTARGHAGDNAGRRRLIAALRTPDHRQSGAPVFGCSLTEPERAAKVN